ncbi:MAG: RsiV family protein [Muribaculaceae bacterium]|nr:RsiV family protein [Muribaculaceae bacterium]
MKSIISKSMVYGSAAILIGALASCSGNDAKGDFNFSSYEMSAVADGHDSDSLRNVLEDFDGRWDVKVSGVLPERLGSKSVAELRDSLCRLANVSFDEKGKTVVEYPAEMRELAAHLADSIAPDRKPGSAFENSLSVSMLTPKLVVFNSYMYSYPEGAPHGVWLNSYVNYDIQAGEILTYSDIFTEGFSKMLVPAILNKLEAQGVQILMSREEIGTRMPRQFRLMPDGMEFVYNIYEIAPYSAGEPRVKFTYGELESLLRPAAKALLMGGGE